MKKIADMNCQPDNTTLSIDENIKKDRELTKYIKKYLYVKVMASATMAMATEVASIIGILLWAVSCWDRQFKK